MSSKTMEEVCDLAATEAGSILHTTCGLHGYEMSDGYLAAIVYLIERSLACDLTRQCSGENEPGMSLGAYLLVISGWAEQLGMSAIAQASATDDATEAKPDPEAQGPAPAEVQP